MPLNPALPALALAGCAGLGCAGLWLRRTDPPGTVLLALDEQVLERRQRRSSLVGLLLESLGNRFGPAVGRLHAERRQDAVRDRLDAAGRPNGLTLERYWGRKAAFSILAAVPALLLLAAGSTIVPIVLLVLGWFYVDVVLTLSVRRRQAAIARDLPDFLDILVVAVGAGLAFRQAMERVATASKGPLAEEMTLALRQMAVGVSRRRSLEQLRARNRSPNLSQFVTAILQAEELGAPLSSALEQIGADMRRSTAQDARRAAARAAPRVSLIVTTVIMPGVILLLVVALVLGSGAGSGVGNLLGK
jgi:tight adherence protein C